MIVQVLRCFLRLFSAINLSERGRQSLQKVNFSFQRPLTLNSNFQELLFAQGQRQKCEMSSHKRKILANFMFYFSRNSLWNVWWWWQGEKILFFLSHLLDSFNGAIKILCVDCCNWARWEFIGNEVEQKQFSSHKILFSIVAMWNTFTLLYWTTLHAVEGKCHRHLENYSSSPSSTDCLCSLPF